MPHLVLTPGDPSGIGPEITVKALQRLVEFPNVRLSVVGSLKALESASSRLQLPLPQNAAIDYRAVENEQPGVIAFSAIDQAVTMLAAKEADALVTGPISKRNLVAAGYKQPGHTEILEELAKTYFKVENAKAEMLFVYKKFRLLLLTRHIALKQVPEALAAPGAVARPLKTLIAFLRQQLKIDHPHIALLGVNPHAGEIGGEEESKFLLPVIKAVNAIGGSKLDGPFAADGFFRGFEVSSSPYDAIVAAYHDQGLIPFKILAGYEAVNVTIGLPFLRTSVSHGTADDIEGKGMAREDSLMAALHTAIQML